MTALFSTSATPAPRRVSTPGLTGLRRAAVVAATLGLLGLSGCVAYDPYDYGYYYPAPAYYGPAYVPAPVVVGGGWGWGGGWHGGGGGWHGGGWHGH